MKRGNTDTPTLRETASYYRAGLALRLIPASEIIAWADRMVAERPDVPPDLLELSITSPEQDVRIRELLGDLAFSTFGQSESATIVGALFDRIRSELDTGVRPIETTLAILDHARQALPLPSDFRLALWRHGEEFAADVAPDASVWRVCTLELLATMVPPRPPSQ
jgi:hypothetical protein